MKKNLFALFIVLLAFSPCIYAQAITTIAGDSTGGYNGDNIPAVTAKLHFPQSIAVDNVGNVYIGDIGNSRIRKISTSGIITTYGGTGSPGYSGDGGPATAADLNAAYMAVDNLGNLYLSDPLYNSIRMISTDGIIRRIAGTGTAGYSGDGGSATAATFNQPAGIVADDTDNIYVSDYNNNCVRKITYKGIVTTIAGGGTSGLGDGGPATAAELFLPEHITRDATGNLFVCSGSRIREISSSGTITTFAGKETMGTYLDGKPATASILGHPEGLAADAYGNVYLSESSSHRVRKITADGIINTVAGRRGIIGNTGNGGPATAATLYTPVGLAIDKAGSLYIADYDNHNIRRIASTTAVNAVADEHLQAEMIAYPNPCHGTLTMSMITSADQEAKVTVLNIVGECVKEFSMMTNKQLDVKLNVPRGAYFVIAKTASEVSSRQIIVE